ncbi:YbfB/YjiJ family MFS transporter [Enterovirga sp. CN4-39]|uniref:YbfB/YjiJ family MFS transporter n=1 Tax=Enterovirga sp. CN4-39 TaxID=3400910 RepID=UPI003C113C4C
MRAGSPPVPGLVGLDKGLGPQAQHRPADAKRFPASLVAWGLLAVALDIGIARITYGTALPAIRRDLGLSYTASGLLGAANLAAYLVGTLLAPYVAGPADMRKLASYGHLAFAAGALASAAAADAIILCCGRVLMGVGAGFGLVGVFMLVFAEAQPRHRGLASVAIWSGTGFAIVASALAVPWLLPEPEIWRVAFLLAGALGAAAAIRFGLTPRPKAAPAGSSEDASGSAKPGAFAALFGAYLLFGSAYIAYATFVGADLAARDASLAVVAWTWLSLGAGSLLGSAGGALLARFRVTGLSLALVLFSGALGAFCTGTGGVAGSLLGAALVGLGLSFAPAVVTALVRERTSEAAYPRLFSFATGALGVGLFIGPAIAGWLADALGSASVTAFAAACYLGGTVLALLDAASSRRDVRPAPSPT